MKLNHGVKGGVRMNKFRSSDKRTFFERIGQGFEEGLAKFSPWAAAKQKEEPTLQPFDQTQQRGRRRQNLKNIESEVLMQEMQRQKLSPQQKKNQALLGKFSSINKLDRTQLIEEENPLNKTQIVQYDPVENEDSIIKPPERIKISKDLWKTLHVDHQNAVLKKHPDILIESELKEIRAIDQVNEMHILFQEKETFDNHGGLLTGIASNEELIQKREQRIAVQQQYGGKIPQLPRLVEFFDNLAQLQLAKNQII